MYKYTMTSAYNISEYIRRTGTERSDESEAWSN